MLGIADESVVHSQTLSLGTGDSLVLHTDGVTEAHGFGDTEQLDDRGVTAALDRCAPGADAGTLADALVDAANQQTGGAPTDDIGVVVIRVGSSSPRPTG